jgi:recombinational DNA repair protein RecR
MASISVRRLAWAMGKSMPAAVDLMVKLLKTVIDSSKVCELCRDKTKCQTCTFSQKINLEELSVLEAVI